MIAVELRDTYEVFALQIVGVRRASGWGYAVVMVSAMRIHVAGTRRVGILPRPVASAGHARGPQ